MGREFDFGSPSQKSPHRMSPNILQSPSHLSPKQQVELSTTTVDAKDTITCLDFGDKSQNSPNKSNEKCTKVQKPEVSQSENLLKLQAKYTAQSKELETLKQKNISQNELKQDLERYEQANTELKSQLIKEISFRKKMESARLLEQKVQAQLENELIELEDDLDRKDKQMEQLNNQLNQKEKEILRFKDINQKEAIQLQKALSEVTSSKANNKKFEVKYQQAEDSRLKLTKLLEESKCKSEHLQNKVCEINEEVSDLQGRLNEKDGICQKQYQQIKKGAEKKKKY